VAHGPRTGRYTGKGNKSSIEQEDIHWRRATLGEACLLLGKSKAVAYYQRAWTHKNTVTEHAHESIKKQALRIIRQQPTSGTSKKMTRIREQLRKLFES
jgi:hypothetical protein